MFGRARHSNLVESHPECPDFYRDVSKDETMADGGLAIRYIFFLTRFDLLRLRSAQVAQRRKKDVASIPHALILPTLLRRNAPSTT